MNIDELMLQLGKMENEEEYLSIIVMILERYLSKYNRDLGQTMTLIRKGYNKYLEFLKEGE